MTAPASDVPLWRTPVARLPLWPLILLGPGSMFLAGALGLLELIPGLGLLLIYVPSALWWWKTARERGHSPGELFGAPPSARQLGLLMAALLALSAVRVGWLALLSSHDLVPELWVRAAQAQLQRPDPAWLDWLGAVVLAPFVEEIAFRGIAFRRLARKRGLALAALWSSLLFGLIHFDVVGALLGGLVLAALYVQSGTLWVPILAHAAHNAASVLPSAVIDASSGYGWAVASVQLVAVPSLVWFIYRSLRPRSTPVSVRAHTSTTQSPSGVATQEST